MNKFQNSKQVGFLESIPTASIENANCTLTKKCKFNFAYFEKQSASHTFSDLDKDQLVELFDKLRDFSREHLSYWMTMPAGKSGTILSIYGTFPAKSDMTHPKHVPHQAQWGRFRLDWSGRLCGFVVPKEVDGTAHEVTKNRFDANTFYAVFLDLDHKFYKGQEAK